MISPGNLSLLLTTEPVVGVALGISPTPVAIAMTAAAGAAAAGVVGGGAAGAGAGLHGAPIPLDDVSPVTLAADWSRVARLLTLAALSIIGCVGNVFMISAVMIEDHLKKRGNAFIANVALADLLITGVVFPVSIVMLLAGSRETASACSLQWLLSVLSCLVTVLTLAAIAAENFARLCLSPECYERLTPARITGLIIVVWVTSAILVGVQTAYRLGPDYCHRRFPGLVPYRATVVVLFVGVPAFITFLCYGLILTRAYSAKAQPAFKPPAAFSWDFSLMKTNLYSFLMFVIFWLPFGVVLSVGSLQNISPRLFYNLAWFALSKSCLNNFLYCLSDRHFRSAYVNLFHYCCCKTTVSFSRRPRGEVTRPTGDVRVHIIPAYNIHSYTSPQRAREPKPTGTAKRAERGSRPAMSRPAGREVYEL